MTPSRRDSVPDPAPAAELAERYLDLLESAITHTLYDPIDAGSPPEHIREAFAEEIRRTGHRPVNLGKDPAFLRAEGYDWPVYALTMIGQKRLSNLRELATRALVEEVPGDMIETGCWRGGAALMMRGVLAAYDSPRGVWVADSFRGLPKPNVERYPADEVDQAHTASELAIPRATVEANFERFGLLDEQVHFVEGWFSETLPALAEREWSVIRLDGDLYESTMDALVNLYPGLQPGGFLIVDDYGWDNCRQAVDDYREEMGITDEIVEIDWTGAYWQRSAG